MIERRVVLKMGLAATAALGLRLRPSDNGRTFDAVVIDGRFFDAGVLAPEGARVHVIDGDVTALWYRDLDRRWRRPGFVVAGYTGAGPLFVLERLAGDRGRRVVHRESLSSADDGNEPLVHWIIAPTHPSVLA